MRIEQRRQRTQQAALGLPAQSQQDEVVAGQHRIDHLRDYRILVANDAREQFLAALEATDQVLAHFVFHAACGQALLVEFGGAKGSQGCRSGHEFILSGFYLKLKEWGGPPGPPLREHAPV